jgi:hypothetical protein
MVPFMIKENDLLFYREIDGCVRVHFFFSTFNFFLSSRKAIIINTLDVGALDSRVMLTFPCCHFFLGGCFQKNFQGWQILQSPPLSIKILISLMSPLGNPWFLGLPFCIKSNHHIAKHKFLLLGSHL